MRLDRERLLDIVDAIEAIDRYRPENKMDFDDNELVRVWCLRHLEIIGEAAANLSADTRALDRDIPWKQIIGMRNTLVHAYFDVNWGEVWNVIARDLRPLKTKVQALLATMRGEQS